jgi:hypothetical protein
MKQYFANHPVITYRGLNIRNLMLNAQVVKGVLRKTSVVYPYTLEEGDTPTMIAYDYYGSVDYVWLVLMSNNMIDPYTDWYKSQIDFDAYIDKKYGSYPYAMSTTHHYKHSDPEYPMITPTTYQYMTAEEQGQCTPVSIYDYEQQRNEERRIINLIDSAHAPRIALELERLLND